MLRPVLFSFLSLVRYNSQLVQTRLSMARGYEWSAALFFLEEVAGLDVEGEWSR